MGAKGLAQPDSSIQNENQNNHLNAVNTGYVAGEMYMQSRLRSARDPATKNRDCHDMLKPNTALPYLFIKRFLDIILSGTALILLSPVMLVTAVAIKIEDPKEKVFYNAPRGGKDGLPFICHKFRSMNSSADALKASLMGQNEMSGPVFKIRDDPRVTKVGRFIRKTSIDELPQLYDVFRGAMSLVGPRPLPVDEEDGVHGIYKARELVKPGITCIWQVSGRNDIDFDEWMEMDMEYIQNQSTLLDLKLLLMTVPAVLSSHGAS